MKLNIAKYVFIEKPRGVSLVSLIITIIVIIILASIVIFNGFDTPDKASLAKFVSEIGDFRNAVLQDYAQRKAKSAVSGKRLSDAQIFYGIANNRELEKDEEVELAGKVSDLQVSGISGTEYYLIPNDQNVANWQRNVKYYSPDEKHYVTDTGDVFIVPGYRVEENGEEKWYLNDKVIR